MDIRGGSAASSSLTVSAFLPTITFPPLTGGGGTNTPLRSGRLSNVLPGPINGLTSNGRKSMTINGRHRHFHEASHRLSSLYVTMLQQLGMEIDEFAASVRRLSEVLQGA